MADLRGSLARSYAVYRAADGALVAGSVELASTSSSRRKGLLGVESLPNGVGLWINPSEAIHTFGMKFPIDLIFIDRQSRIRKLRKHVPSRRIAFCFTACSVLELSAGTIERAGLSAGELLRFDRLSAPRENSA